MDVPTILQKHVSKVLERKKTTARATGDSDNRQMECTPQKYFRCGSEDYLIARCTKPL